MGNNSGNSGNNLGNNSGILDNISDNNSGNNLGNNLSNKHNKLSHIQNSKLTDKDIDLLLQSLQKNKEKIFKYVLNLCITNDEYDTGPIFSQKTASDINIPYKSFKTILNRLIKTKLIARNEGKTSQVGYIDIHIFKNVKDKAIIFYGLNSILNNSLGNGLGNGLGNNYDSSSSNLYKTTTIGEAKNLSKSKSQLPSEWQKVDLAPLTAIGFTENHLLQISSQNKLSADMVQDSIYAFAFDLQENNKAKTIKSDPINFFMGILRTGKIYTFPGNYESPQDKSLRLYRENKRKIEQERIVAEKEAINLAFNEWFIKLTNGQKIELLPELLRHNTSSEKLGKSKILESSARNRFETEIWPKIKEKIFEGKE